MSLDIPLIRNKYIIKFKKLFDKDLLYTGINQMWRLISGPLYLLFIPLFLTEEVQGYWYTFVSLSALSVFADLGFTNIVLQFSAHEFAYLTFDKDFTAFGSDLNLGRLGSLFIFVIKWAVLMIVIIFPIILLIGIIMFSSKNTSINWFLPWVLYLVGAAINFFNTSILSFIEGCNLVYRVQKIRFEASVFYSLTMFVLLYFRFNLYSLAIAMFLSSTFIFFHFISVFRKFIKQLILLAKEYRYSWKKEFFRLMWKYAISFASGYFIFQIYTPIAFKFHGPIEAGKIGLSITLWMAIFNLSNVWIYSITPKLNILVSRQDWRMLDRIFFRNLALACITFGIGSLIIFVLYIGFKGRINIIDRFAESPVMVCLSISLFLQLIITSLAIYLRAHKEEPLVVPSVFIGIYTLISTIVCAEFLPAMYLFFGFISSYIWILPWCISIFKRKRELWHEI